MWTYRAKYVRAIDGDTIEMCLDLGFYVQHIVRIRVKGIDCPEVRGETREAGVVAKRAAHGWFIRCTTEYAEAVGEPVSWRAPVDDVWPFTVKTGKGRSFDRWIGDIYYDPPDGELTQGFGWWMKGEGHAT